MTTYNAYVTVDRDGKLALGSMVTVEDDDGRAVAFNEVPALASAGGVMFWPRVREALKEVGWTLNGVGPAQGWAADGDVVRFNAQLKED